MSRPQSEHCLEALGLLGNGFKAYAKRNHLGCCLCNLFTQLNTPCPHPPPTSPQLLTLTSPPHKSLHFPFFRPAVTRSEPQRRKGQSRLRWSVSPLSAGACTATLLVMVERVKVAGRASPYPRQAVLNLLS